MYVFVLIFNSFLLIASIVKMQSPDECFNISINNTKRIGKLELCILFVNNYILFSTFVIRQYNRLLKSKS